MKKILLTTLLLATTAVLYTGCKKDDNDTTAPVITIDGDNPYYVVAVDEDFEVTDPGATALDDNDGDLTADLTYDYSEYIQNVAGEYEVHYEVADKAGNAADEHRMLYVTHTGARLAGITFHALDTTTQAGTTVNLDYNSVASSSSLAANKWKVYLDNFNDGLFTSGSKVELDMQANRITIPPQAPNGGGSAITVSGSGTMTFNSVSGYKLYLTYTIVGVAGGNITDKATFTSL